MPNGQVHSKTGVARDNARGTYQPLTQADVRRKSESDLFAGLESRSSRSLAGLLFGAIFILSRGLPEVSSALAIVLLVCLLYRMDERERRIAAIPLAFGAVRLVFSFALHFMRFTGALAGGPTNNNDVAFLDGLFWLPILFAAYLFYSPWKESNTSRVIFWYSAALLLSGLLPGEGYLCVWYAAVYTVFFAIGVAMIIDFGGGASTERARPLAPPEPQPAPQPAFT